MLAPKRCSAKAAKAAKLAACAPKPTRTHREFAFPTVGSMLLSNPDEQQEQRPCLGATPINPSQRPALWLLIRETREGGGRYRSRPGSAKPDRDHLTTGSGSQATQLQPKHEGRHQLQQGGFRTTSRACCPGDWLSPLSHAKAMCLHCCVSALLRLHGAFTGTGLGRALFL